MGAEAAEAATNFSYVTAERLHKTWLDFWGQLFMTHVDGYHTVPDPKNSLGHCEKRSPEFDEAQKKRIVAETGDRYLVPQHLLEQDPSVPKTIDKLSLIALGGNSRRT